MTVKIAVLASGRGSNFRAILDAIKSGECHAECRVLVTDNPEAKAIQFAKEHGIPVEIVDKTKYAKRAELDLHIKKTLDYYGAELVVLAGYMLLIKGKEFLLAYKNKIINIHPALLPAFPGDSAQKDAFEYGTKVSGLTIHFVDETLDGGAIIYQEAVDISDCQSVEEVSQKILACEHKAYPKVIDSFARGSYVIEGRRTRYSTHH